MANRHTYGHSWPVRWGDEGEQKEILVYSNQPEVELFVNGVSAGKKRRNPQDYPAQGFHWNVMMQNCCRIKAPPQAQAAFRQPTAEPRSD